jgi:hypothetical protein
VKFLCIQCDEVMEFVERQLPGDGTLAALYTCPVCRREMALLTNPMETQLVSSMGVKIGGREVPAQPMEVTRTSLDGGSENVFQSAGSAGTGPHPVEWTPEAVERLQRVPSFVRGMVKRIYTDYAREREIRVLTPEVMDTARSELGLEGM